MNTKLDPFEAAKDHRDAMTGPLRAAFRQLGTIPLPSLLPLWIALIVIVERIEPIHIHRFTASNHTLLLIATLAYFTNTPKRPFVSSLACGALVASIALLLTLIFKDGLHHWYLPLIIGFGIFVILRKIARSHPELSAMSSGSLRECISRINKIAREQQRNASIAMATCIVATALASTAVLWPQICHALANPSMLFEPVLLRSMFDRSILAAIDYGMIAIIVAMSAWPFLLSSALWHRAVVLDRTSTRNTSTLKCLGTMSIAALFVIVATSEAQRFQGRWLTSTLTAFQSDEPIQWATALQRIRLNPLCGSGDCIRSACNHIAHRFGQIQPPRNRREWYYSPDFSLTGIYESATAPRHLGNAFKDVYGHSIEAMCVRGD
jgi:hypothetical protein